VQKSGRAVLVPDPSLCNIVPNFPANSAVLLDRQIRAVPLPYRTPTPAKLVLKTFFASQASFYMEPEL
jgi:hypothetical protein